MILDYDKLPLAVEQGFKRLNHYKRRRTALLREYCGRYMREDGIPNPINLLFSTMRAFIPNLVMRTGVTEVTTEILEHKRTAAMLGHALGTLHEELQMKDDLRTWIIDAMFAIGIMEVGLATSDQLIGLEQEVWVDPGRIFHQIISLDDFVIDPMCTNLKNAFFMGHVISAPREHLLALEGVDKEAVRRLPRLTKTVSAHAHDAKRLSQSNNNDDVIIDMGDFVEVVKLYVPSARATIYMADPRGDGPKEILAVHDFYGPESGPYCFLALSQPMTDNPLPIAPVGVWYDLHKMSNRIFKKMMSQADAQKDIVLYDPTVEDTVRDIAMAGATEAVACRNPDAINKISLGGANVDNVGMLGHLSAWYNLIAGNPEQLAGSSSNADTATQAEILQANSSITINDMRDMVYEAAARISAKDAWYLWTDPLIKQGQTQRDEAGREVQVWLTPEQMEGDFLEYNFKIKQRSMSRLDPTIRTRRIVDFAANVVPASVMAAQAAGQMGVQFNLQRYLTHVAEELDIQDMLMDVFDDPEFAERMAMIAELGVQDSGKAGIKGAVQNGGNPMTRNVSTDKQLFNANSQETAAVSQSARRNNLDVTGTGV